MTVAQPGLNRTLDLHDAVMIGLAAMIGAGVFSVFPPAAQLFGAVLCATLVVTLPVWSVVGGLTVIAVGVLGRLLLRKPDAKC